MTSQETKVERSFDKLGLPPMELAETTCNGRSTRDSSKCFLSFTKKLLVAILLAIFGAGTYILLLKLLDNTDNIHSTEIILVTGIQENPNITLQDEDVEIILHLKNKTDINKTRKKRNTVPSNDAAIREDAQKLQENRIQHIKDTIARYGSLCRHDNETPICKDLYMKLKMIAEKDHTDLNNKNDLVEKISRINFKLESTDISRESMDSDGQHIAVAPEALNNHEIINMGNHQNILESVPHREGRESHVYGYGNPVNMVHPPQPHSSHLTDTCLLARLLKHKHPHLHGIYDVPATEYLGPHYDHQPLPHTRYHPLNPPSYIRGRDIETRKSQLHPQDVDILMSLLTSKPEVSSIDLKTNSSTRETICSAGTVPCNNGEDCVPNLKWCDGNVDCADASDEAKCACKHRVEKSRLCDGYFDCPFGEDEMGCFGCDENMFSCEDLDANTQSGCFTKEQRCDNRADCRNQRDEVECNMLAPSLHEKSLYAISNTEGYLHRNFKGDWYAVCKNPYMWAHDACRRETGIIIRPPFIQFVPVDPLMKVHYLNPGPSGLFHTDTCFNSSAVYVTCPDVLCGTRVLSTSQMLKENAVIENQIFGRNKRFLLPDQPYPVMYYGNRKKRDVDDFKMKSADESILTDSETIYQKILEKIRKRRAEGRVVGGRPSQPAAWPWMVAIYRNGMFHCGGVVLTQNWVMSAAHCVHKFWDHYYEIQVGMLRRFSFSPQEHNHKVTHIIVNQHYRQIDMKNDLSLLRVEPVIQFSRWVRPVCLPGPDTAGPDWLWGPTPGTICTAVGWGATIEHGPDPDHMREVEVPIWENCKHRDDRAGKEICAGPVEGGKDACQGDSGGPLLCRNPLNAQQWHIAGIVSHGDGCARKDEPGVYTRVSLFVKWIKYHISSESLPIVQPIQDCPGFKCKSGFSKCIPHKRKCDKIIDCLGGEDELGCDFTKTANNFGDNMFMNEMFKSSENNSNSEVSRITKGADNSFITDSTVNSDITNNPLSSISIIESTTMADIMLTTHNTHEKSTESIDDKTEKNKDNLETNFEHASTLEIPFSISSEDTLTYFQVDTTTNLPTLTTTNELTVTSSDNSQSVTVSFIKDSLESRSSILQNELDQQSDGSEHFQESVLKWDWTTDNITPTELSTTSLKEDSESISSNHLESTTEIKAVEGSKSLITGENNENERDPTIFISEYDKLENNSEELVIPLLPTTEISKIDNFDDNENNISNIITEPPVKSNTSKHVLPKQLTDFEDKKDINKKMEEIVFSELQSPIKRRKPRIPKEFECGRITQVIPFHQRCNQKSDCEDGTDELGCTCIDYLSTLDEKLLCDGNFDCADGQDEIDCFVCPEEYFLCKRSQNCLSMKNVCDGKADCPQGEDELDCFALTNGKDLQYDIDERPQINIEGYVTKRYADEWHIVCEDTLSLAQIEETASHICNYLGFRAANRYFVKYINVKEDQITKERSNDKREKREIDSSIPVHFAYRNAEDESESMKHIVIKEPQIIPEQCVPNITKTCKSLYVFCDQSLFTNFDESEGNFINRATSKEVNKTWPWVAKIYVEGNYKCTGVLIDLSWVLISHSCLWDTNNHNFILVILGAQRILSVTNGPLEQIYRIDAKKDLYRNKVILLHLNKPAKYSNVVKPMLVSSNNHFYKNNMCVAVGQDKQNRTVNVFLEETKENCTSHNICFKQKEMQNICDPGMTSDREWAGIITCHTEQGWYPVASFVDSRGECGLGNHILATEIENLKNVMRYHLDSMDQIEENSCGGHRCSRGRCIGLHEVCDGVRHCEDGSDESAESCNKKHNICEHDRFAAGCECASGQMKCRNGNCISKSLFRDGHDDCGDGTDEPGYTTCSDYLARVMPSKLCDGILHCHDRSDEDPVYCKCYAKKTYKCGRKTRDGDHCVALDMVCDGIRDCPRGEDEQTCIGLSAPEGTPYGTGQVIIRSHGVWYSKCYTTPNHTKTELEAICRELGFISGHAKEIKDMDVAHPHNNIIIDSFSDVVLNNNTIIKMRNTHEPIAKAVFNEKLENCYPVFIECV